LLSLLAIFTGSAAPRGVEVSEIALDHDDARFRDNPWCIPTLLSANDYGDAAKPHGFGYLGCAVSN